MEDVGKAIRVFQDTTIEGQVTYEYRIGAIDKGGNMAFSEIKKGKIERYDFGLGIEDFTVQNQEGYPLLMWESVPPGALRRVILYRRTDDGDWITYKVFSQQDLRANVSYQGGRWLYQYIDTAVYESRSYGYCLRQIWQDGRTSKRSEMVDLKL